MDWNQEVSYAEGVKPFLVSQDQEVAHSMKKVCHLWHRL